MNDFKGLGLSQKRMAMWELLDVHDIDGILSYYPYRYDTLVYHMPDPDFCLDGRVVGPAKLIYHRGYQSRMNFSVAIQDHVYQVAIYNRHFLLNKLKPGQWVTMKGKQSGPDELVCAELHLGKLEDLNALTPVYSQRQGFTSKQIWGDVKKALKYKRGQIPDFIPEPYRQRYRLISKEQALNWIHCPENERQAKMALRHLKYEEFLKYQLLLCYVSSNRDETVKPVKDFAMDEVREFVKGLPFTLTADQKKVAQEILRDLHQDHRMNRLVQGDVGSGKTVVAVIAMYANYLAGYQSAFMAPTEILARQHFKNLQDYFQSEEIHLALLVGGMTAKEKKAIYDGLANGDIDMVVGTHALIQDPLTFQNLGLVIADEQQRFGVRQRQALAAKGEAVDLLMMSATPIPRTLAITLYGDMSLSAIHTMPAGHRPVKTKFFPGQSMKPFLSFLKGYLKTGQQAYVVCPLVDESDALAIRDAQSIYEGMASYFDGHYQVGLLHGRMSEAEKDAVMADFRDNKLQILVATTVIEVGVDVANANLIVIYNADRFGLSQLHQLRGRVGRAGQQGYCILLSDADNEAALERLKYLENNDDGFAIAEYDLKVRGPGELLGERQSGLPRFAVADIYEDYHILETARRDARDILANLAQYPTCQGYLHDTLTCIKSSG